MNFRRFRRRWARSRAAYKLENARQQFFGYNPIGAKTLAAVDRLHERFPKSAVVHKIWLYCLPF